MFLLKFEMEKRLHRVKIELDENRLIMCQFAKRCNKAENSFGCNSFYHKCSKFKDFIGL